MSQKDKAIHNFVEHYQQVGILPFEDRSIKINRFDGLNEYSISFNEQRFLYFFILPIPLQISLILLLTKKV